MDPSPRIDVLGPLRVHRDAREVPVAGPTLRLVLAGLTAAGGRPVPADRLVDTLWGDNPPPTAHRSLQAHVSRLRGLLGSPDAIAATPAGYTLAVPAEHIDARRFERLVAEAEDQPDPVDALARLDEALGLWSGDAYAGLADREHIRPEAVRLDEMRLAAVERRFELLIASGEATAAVAELESHVAAHPLREGGWLLLARALAGTGRNAEAMRALDRLHDALAEVGMEPSPRARDVQDAILRPPPPAIGTMPSLPRRPTSFVGRGTEVEELTALVGDASIVTLVGPPGVGKSRLALELAHRIGPTMPDGAVLIPLAPLADGSAVTAAVANRIAAGPVAPTLEGIVAALRARRMLLVLDNCDELVEEAAVLVEQVSLHCPGVRSVATSRERLGVDGEHVHPVMPLALDAGDGLSDAARLFADRARASSPSFRHDESTAAVVESICAALDGVPLAIEMAAAQLRTVPLDLIAGEIPGDVLHASRRTADRRHQSLPETVAWTYRLLDPEGRLLFDTVSCFRGGFDAESAAAVFGAPVGATRRLLGDLVDRSLLRLDPATGRYGMLEVLRQIGAGWLQQRGRQTETWAAHARWFVDRAEEASRRVQGPEEPAAIAVVERDFDNLRMAHRNALRHGDVASLTRLHGALYYFSGIPLGGEMLGWSQQTLDAIPDPGEPRWPVVYASAALAALNRGDPDAAFGLTEAGKDLRGSDRLAVRHIHEIAADVSLQMGRLADVVTEAELAVTLAGEAGDDFCGALALAVQAMAHSYAGEHDLAITTAEGVRSIALHCGAPTLLAWSAYVDGEILLDRDPQAAIAHMRRAVDIAATIRSDFVHSVAEVSLASMQARHGDPGEAVATFATVIERWRRLADWGHQWTTLRNLVRLLVRLDAGEEAAVVYGGTIDAPLETYGEEEARLIEDAALLRERLGMHAYEAAISHGRSLTPDELVDYALAVLADLAA